MYAQCVFESKVFAVKIPKYWQELCRISINKLKNQPQQKSCQKYYSKFIFVFFYSLKLLCIISTLLGTTLLVILWILQLFERFNIFHILHLSSYKVKTTSIPSLLSLNSNISYILHAAFICYQLTGLYTSHMYNVQYELHLRERSRFSEMFTPLPPPCKHVSGHFDLPCPPNLLK